MGNFSNNAITDVGKMMLADVQAGAVFTPTRIVIGSGSLTGGATAQSMTDVITPVVSITINKKKRTPDGKCIFGGVYSNAEVTEAFYFRELALYAKAVYLNEDGSVKSEGEETLYSYGNAGTTADYMPAYSTATVVEKQIDLVTWVGNDAQVDLTIESGVYLTQNQAVLNLEYINPDTVGFDTLLEYMASVYEENIIVSGHISGFSDMPEGVTIMHGTINVVGGMLTVYGNARTTYYYRGTNSLTEWTDEWRKVYDSSNKPTLAELGAAPAGYGLGEDGGKLADADINKAVKVGFYSMPGNTAVNHPAKMRFSYYGTLLVERRNGDIIHQTVRRESQFAIRYSGDNGSTWGEWEYLNPEFEPGVEYRTTERRNGTAVFKMLGTDGILKYRLEGSSTWIPYAQETGGVKKAGDIMSGDLTIEKAIAALNLKTAKGTAKFYKNANTANDLGTVITDETEGGNVATFIFSAAKSLEKKMQIVADGGTYTILHSGNLSTFGIGAVPASVE